MGLDHVGVDTRHIHNFSQNNRKGMYNHNPDRRLDLIF